MTIQNRTKTVLTLAVVVTVVTASAVLGVSQTALGATISQFNFTTNVNPSTEAANTSSSSMSGFGFTPGGSPSFGLSNFAMNYFGRGPDDSFDVNDDYVFFTITPDAGFYLDLTQLTFDYGVQDAGAPDFNATFSVRSSLDAYASDIAVTYSTNPLGIDSGGSTPEMATANLSGGTRFAARLAACRAELAKTWAGGEESL
jgi:hypothetical protein